MQNRPRYKRTVVTLSRLSLNHVILFSKPCDRADFRIRGKKETLRITSPFYVVKAHSEFHRVLFRSFTPVCYKTLSRSDHAYRLNNLELQRSELLSSAIGRSGNVHA